VGLLKHHCAIPASAIFRPQWPALGASIGMGACVWGLRLAMESSVRDLIALPILVLAGGAIYAVLVALTMPDVVARFAPRLLRRA
jgi:hypothetical protein